MIGRRLVPMLVQAGHRVVGLTRSGDNARLLERLGAETALADVFDAAAMLRAVEDAQADVLIHQLTDLSGSGDVSLAIERNARIRREGTINLVLAARHAGVGRFIAQSIAWAYAPGPHPFREDAALDTTARGTRAVTIGGVVALERAVLGDREMHPIVLRYGRLYGQGAGFDRGEGDTTLHVDAAASAAALAVTRGTSGIYNVADKSPTISSEKAARELGWRSNLRDATSPA